MTSVRDQFDVKPGAVQIQTRDLPLCNAGYSRSYEQSYINYEPGQLIAIGALLTKCQINPGQRAKHFLQGITLNSCVFYLHHI